MATNPIPYRPAPVSFFDKPPEAPGFLREASTAWTLGTINQSLFRAEEYLLNAPEQGFNPWAHMKGYERYAESLINARSTAEIDAMKQRIDFNLREKDIAARGDYGMVAQVVGGLFDPINFIPIPVARGIGLVKGAAVGAASNAALAAVTEPIRIGVDPTADWNELAYSVGGAALFGAALGGVSGAIPVRGADYTGGRARMDRFVAELSDIEGTNIARPFNAAEESYAVVSGNTRSMVDGRYEPVRIETVDIPVRQKQASDGNLYNYDDRMGWTLEADRGSADPRPVAQDILDELGVPERTTENRMIVDEAALKADFEEARYTEARAGRDPLKREDFRTAGEYVTFRQIEAVWRQRDPIKPGENPVVYANRIQASALEELKASRASASVARRGILAPYLDKVNFSPVAKAVRLFSNDNILSDLPLQIAGDYGWAIRANEFGYKTPPSLLMRAMRHNVAFAEIRSAIDEQWVKYVQRNANATGMNVLGQNVTASAEAIKARVKNLTGGKALTKPQFSRMAGRAVFEKEPFLVDGFEVVPEAREAAKAWVRVAQKYDKEARELGLFYDQRSLEKTVKTADAKIASLQRSIAAWLWGGKQAPSKLYPAVKVGDQIFSGASHEEAVTKAFDQLGTGIEITPASYGYVDNLATSNPPRGVEPDALQQERESYAAFIEANQEEFDRLQTLEEQGVVDLEGQRFLSEMRDRIRMAGEAPAAANQNALGDRAAAMSAPSGPSSAAPKVAFRDMTSVIEDRLASLSTEQRRFYDDWKADIDELILSRDGAKAQLDAMKAEPHRFLDQYGEPEPYFARFWNHSAIASDREKFRRLLTKWYERDNPNGAVERADKTIDDMLRSGDADDEMPATVPGLRHLAKRKLDMPNSWKVSDPELGEIVASDFFNTDLEVVAEAYTRGMGHKIEAARMFGDAALWEKTIDIKQHFRESYFIKALDKGASKAEIDKLLTQRDEYLGQIDLIKRAVLGGLKTRDPWAMDNRIARNLKNYQVLTSMGRVLLTAIPEAMRVPMVNGFGTAFRGLWLRAFADMDKIKANVEFSRTSGELMDLIRDIHAARTAELNTPDPGGGGTWVEKQLEALVSPFFKLVGLTHWTVMAKDLTMFTAQHKVMDMARNLDSGDNAFKLAALGISKRDAKLLASMPIDQHGSIILPAVQNWAGPDGRRARTLLLDAIHAEARRAIVTPSLADKSLLFQGVATWRGKKAFESDLMTVPLQFMSYGLAASQKVLMSGLQGRDQNFVLGALGMLALGVFSNYLKQPQSATMNKDLEEWIIEGYEASGVGAFWFSDLNQMIERYTRNQIGIRPILGIDPRFGRTTDVGDYIDAAGPSIGTLADVVLAFTDPEKSATNRAQAIRRAVPYNNVIWWGGIARDLATAAGKSLQ